MSLWYRIDGVNPEPWAVGPVGTGRKNGKVYAYIGPNAQLVAYQNAVREQLGDREISPLVGDVELTFFFWRRLDTYLTPHGRKAHKEEADSTNLQKGLEDALQGILFANDRSVKRITSEVVKQDPDIEPRIVIGAKRYESNTNAIPDTMWAETTAVSPALFDVKDGAVLITDIF